MIGRAHPSGVEDVQVGLVIRAVRIRRGIRQRDVAEQAGVSQSQVSRIERGDLGPATYQSIRKVAAAVGVHVALTPRWRGVELAKLLDERHVAIVQQVVARLADLGWEVRPELTFAVGRETGSIDIFAWLPAYRAVLVIEVKSLVPDMQAMLSAIDRKRRLANTLARQLGWQPSLVGTVLVLPDEGQARNAVERYRAILDASFPARTVAVRRWLRQPDGDIRGIWFLRQQHPGWYETESADPDQGRSPAPSPGR